MSAFKVGDKVRSTTQDGRYLSVGDVGFVHRVHTDGSLLVNWTHQIQDTVMDGQWWVCAFDVVPYVDPAEFVRGDRVRAITGCPSYYAKGEEGTYLSGGWVQWGNSKGGTDTDGDCIWYAIPDTIEKIADNY